MTNNNTFKLEKKVIINGKIIIETGLHIGKSSEGLEIGSVNNFVVRNPIDNTPYLPGSSIKGKMRSLVEKANGLVEGINEGKGGICSKPDNAVAQLFGFPADKIKKDKTAEGENTENQTQTETGNEKVGIAPTRLIVRDAFITEKSKAQLENSDYLDMYLTEIKSENTIDRLTSSANPRHFERVPKGAEFNFEFIVNVYACDKKQGENNREKEFADYLLEGMKLVQDDYLGGHGSRGYGKVRFEVEHVFVRCVDTYYKSTLPENEKCETCGKTSWDIFKITFPVK